MSNVNPEPFGDRPRGADSVGAASVVRRHRPLAATAGRAGLRNRARRRRRLRRLAGVQIGRRRRRVRRCSRTPSQRGEMLVTVTEDGNVESAKNVEIKCQVAGGSSILSIVKDGNEVKQGDKLVELDASQLDDQINQQKITYEKARSALVQAEKDFQVAEISVKEYLEGTFKKELQDAEAQITIALENLRTAPEHPAALAAHVPQGLHQHAGVGGAAVLGPAVSAGTGFRPHGQRRSGELHQSQDAGGPAKQGGNGQGQDGIREGRLCARRVPAETPGGSKGILRDSRAAGRHGRVCQRTDRGAVRRPAGSRRSKKGRPSASGRRSSACPICPRCRSR